MTKDKDLTSRTQEPFQVVLIDLHMAAQGEIHCVKKPLTNQLKYVAISYRWGELEETMMDTGVGYVASITSFYILNFYKLCGDITKAMGSMEYVWVDAICINQTNYDQRKATIYHMSEIYEHATWILAVPDMHSAHLKAMHESVMMLIQKHRVYLYHLLHGNTDQLHKMDQDFLDEIGVPPDPTLRQRLISSTDSFAESFMTPAKVNRCYDHVLVIEHLYDLTQQPNTTSDPCPLDYVHDLSKLPFQPPSKHWGRRIIERRSAIHQTMTFLTNLVVDWSSRVWVISEFHISKKKNNLRFWFNQFRADQDVCFFTVDTNDTRFQRVQNQQGVFSKTTIPVYVLFYQQLLRRLNRQTFFQMMLKSKASRNEDRFRAIFPFFPQYRHLLQHKKFTNLHSIHAVKLKLYEIMTVEDKRLLFYFSAKSTPTYVLPTFATTAIYWVDQQFYSAVVAEANGTMVDISLQGSYLCIKPITYQITQTACANEAAMNTLGRLLHKKVDDEVDVVLLFDTMMTPITIIGSLEHNIWILESQFFDLNFEVVDNLADDFPGFHVY